MANDKQYNVIHEVGDLGGFVHQVNEEENKQINEQMERETENNNEEK